jgi:hypothetical protein
VRTVQRFPSSCSRYRATEGVGYSPFRVLYNWCTATLMQHYIESMSVSSLALSSDIGKEHFSLAAGLDVFDQRLIYWQ